MQKTCRFSRQFLFPCAIAILLGACFVQFFAITLISVSCLLILGLLLSYSCLGRCVLLAFVVGVLSTLLQQCLLPTWPTALRQKPLTMTVGVNGLPSPKPYDYQVPVKVERFNKQLLLRWPKQYGQPQVGERWRIQVRVDKEPPQHQGMRTKYSRLLRQRVSATGLVTQHGKCLSQSHWLAPIAQLRAKLRQVLANTVVQPDDRHVLAALTIGDRSGLRPHQWWLFRVTGTAHLMAISGLHISLVAGLVFILMRRLLAWFPWLILHWPAPRVAAACALLVALLYSAMAGFAVSTQRAVIMLAALMLNQLSGWQLNLTERLALALILVLVWNPFQVTSMGFWLSFTAVAVIIYTTTGRLVSPRHWWRLQVMMIAGLMPLSLWFFHMTSLVSWPANAVAIPVVTWLIVPLAILGNLAGLVSLPLGHWLLSLAALVLRWLLIGLQLLAELPHSVWHWQLHSMWGLMLALVTSGLLLAPRAAPGRALAWVWLAMLVKSSL